MVSSSAYSGMQNTGSGLWLALQGKVEPKFLVQGTLYPDVIESCPPPGSGQKHSHTIKSHHNVGGLPKDLQFSLIEPLRELFKVQASDPSCSPKMCSCLHGHNWGQPATSKLAHASHCSTAEGAASVSKTSCMDR